MPEDAVIRELIELGAGGQDGIPSRLTDPQEAWSALHHGGIPWDDLAAGLHEEDLRHLVRGLVHYSRARGASAVGGSVSPVIRLYAAYVQRFPDSEPDLTEWIVTHRVNPYEPFGSAVYNRARSFSERFDQQLRGAVERRANEDAEQARQREAAKRRRARATEHLASAVKRGDTAAVEALLAQGADPLAALPDHGSLVALALKHGRKSVADLLRRHRVE